MSHLLQMRGLKLGEKGDEIVTPLSHLLQMRGLKLKRTTAKIRYVIVASFTDAWIETFIGKKLYFCMWSHLLQMRGLKHYQKMLCN